MAMRNLYRRPAVVCMAVLLAVILCCSVALGSYSVDFNASDLTLSPRDGGDAVRLADCSLIGEVGYPDLPSKSASISIPSNMDATGVRIVNVEYVDLPGAYTITPCEPPRICGRSTPATTMSAKQALAEAVNLPRGVYPGELVRLGSCGWMRDYHLASVTVYPVQYDTVTGALRMYTHIEFELIMAAGISDVPVIAARSAASDAAFASMARSAVINPLEIKPAPAVWGAAKAMAVVDAEYLIITDASLVSAFQPLADWKKAKGYTTQIVTTATIYGNSSYGTGDNPSKIRACILDYMNNHGTDYVLLGGDSNFVPVRKIGASDSPACDLYYSDLTGDWNADSTAASLTGYPCEDPSFEGGYGSVTNGIYYDLETDDDTYYEEVTAAKVSTSMVASFYYHTYITKNVPSALTLTVNAKANATGGTLRLDLWNFTTGAWLTVKTAASLGTTEVMWNVNAPSPQTRFVDSATGEVRARLYYTARTTQTRRVSIDMLKWVTSGADTLYAEPTDNVDLYPDILGIGRATVNNTDEISTFINKVMQYEGAPSKPTLPIDYELRTELLGGQVFEDMDAALQMEYLADEVIPARFTNTKRYENNGSLTIANVMSDLNAGRNIAVHQHHGNLDLIQLNGDELLMGSDVESLTNTPRYTGFLATSACLAGVFDWEDGRCFGESFLLSPSGGGYFIGNATYGGSAGADPIWALSSWVLTEHVQSLFLRNKVRVGELTASTVSTIAPQAQMDSNLFMCLVEVNLLGDPETPIWTDTPAALTLSGIPTSVIAGQTTNFTINVKKSGTNVYGARVCLLQGTSILVTGETNSSGNMAVSVTPTTAGTITVTVSSTWTAERTAAFNLLPYQADITVTGGGGGSDEVVYPVSPFTYGQTTTNNYTKCASNDNVYHVVTTTTDSANNQQADYFYATRTANTAPTGLTLTVRVKAGSTGGTLQLDLWNCTTSAWETVKTPASLGTSEVAWTPALSSPVSRFVNPSTGEIKCRLEYAISGTSSKTISVDMMQWVISQTGNTTETKYPTSDTDTYCALGTTTSNSYLKCAASDDSYHVVTTALFNGTLEMADFYYKAVTTITSPTALKVTYEGKVSTSATMTLSLLDYTTSNWVVVYNTSAFPTGDTQVEGNATGTISRFVNPDTGEIRCRVNYVYAGTTAQTISTDLVKLTVTQ